MAKASRSPREGSPFGFRRLSVRAESINAEKRTADVVLATEHPVEIFDWQRWDVVGERLLMSGVKWRASNKVPLLDSHDASSVDRVLGSITGLRVDGDQLVGRMEFSSDEAATRAFNKLREGHLGDVSIGFQINSQVRLNAGQKENISGRDFEGPLNVVTSFTPVEGSLVPIGADPHATARSMSVFQRAYLDPESVRMATVNDDPNTPAPVEVPPVVTTTETKEEPVTQSTPAAPAVPAAPVISQADIDAAAERALAKATAQRAAFEADVDALCELADIGNPSQFYRHKDITSVRAAIKDAKAARQSSPLSGSPAPFGYSMGAAGRDKQLDAMRSAFLSRIANKMGANEQRSRDAVIKLDSLAAGWEDFRYARGMDLARACLELDGVDCRRLDSTSIAMSALGFARAAGVHVRSDAAYHTTGSFLQLTKDAINKTLLAGYQEATKTYRQVFRQAESVADFKTIHRIALGTIPNLPVWNDNQPTTQVSFADERESYAVEARGSKVSFSWQLLINDDMDALSRVPFMYGMACERTINKVCWDQITSNPTLARDGVALFAAATGARKRTNLTTGAGAPSTTTVQALTVLMGLMRGVNTPEAAEPADILGIRPTYIAAPLALEQTVMQLVNSTYDPADANMKYNTARNLIPVIEPLLDASSSTAWYLMARPGEVDTVEYTFLQGHETPRTFTREDDDTHSMVYEVVQTYAAKAIDHRGLQKHAGA